MERRAFLSSTLTAPAAGMAATQATQSRIPRMKITRVRAFRPPRLNPTFGLSNMVVTVETDAGITGIGEGGAHDTLELCAGQLIGEDASRIEHLWQKMYRGNFYPAGHEKLHAIGALDIALWDIKAKALEVPLYELFGGLVRDHIECYFTNFPRKETLKETARAAIEAGFRAYRTGPADLPGDAMYNTRERMHRIYDDCVQIREGVGRDGDFVVDFHTRYDLADSVRAARLVEDLEPFFIEDPLRPEAPEVYQTLRTMVRSPLAVGEHYGSRYDSYKLIENQLMDYARISLPNTGGITEFRKITTLCETHYVGLVPHFTGPICMSAQVHMCGPFPGPVLAETTRGSNPEENPHVKQSYDFKNGKIWFNQRPGLGVELDMSRLQQILEVTAPTKYYTLYHRPDGSMTNW